MSQPTFSVVVCTYNRCSLLADVVDSVRKQSYSHKLYEIIVVDNASEDDTQQVAKRLQQEEGAPLHYVYEPHLGFAHARNAGLRASRMDLVAFIDDDAVADPDWLTLLAQVFSQDERAVCVAGRIELQWDTPRPDWLPEELESYLGCNRHLLGFAKRILPPTLYNFGGNMAVRRDALLQAGGFDVRFGRVGSHLRAHGETGVGDRLSKMGLIVYTPDALVFHRVPAERATRSFFLRRVYWQGVGDANLAQQRSPRSRWGLLRSVAANTLFLCQDSCRVIGNWLRRRKKQAFTHFAVATSRLGRLLQTLRLALLDGLDLSEGTVIE